MTLDKSQMRKAMIAQLKQMSNEQKQIIEHKLIENLITSDYWKQATSIGITISQAFEWNTRPIIEAAWKQGKSVCVPKCQPKEKRLVFYQFHTYDQLETVYYSLLEPKPEETLRVEKKQIELLIVPGILFDKNGFRIGFGGGYYDRFLNDFPNETISLTSEQQVVDHLPSESFDIPVNHLMTEKTLIK
ncbi:5-formyltetrahydrofolate cyclo-ligase [Virgibacillus sp. FSP13]